MKTKQIKGAVDILLVDAPGRELFGDEHVYRLKNDGWIIHCRLSEMTEEQAAVMVEITDNPFWLVQEPFIYIDYTNDSNCFETAKESFQSLLEANGVLKENLLPIPNKSYCRYLVNPYHYEFDLQSWQEAEANVFPPETTLIFIKNEPE